MTLPSISPDDAHKLIAKGAQLIDIRGADEYVREHIPGAKSFPLDRLSDGRVNDNAADTLIFHCKSGNRTTANARKLRASTNCNAYILTGGLEAWKASGHIVVRDSKQPLEMIRQVQIAAGGLAFVGSVLGFMVHPGFHALSGAVGAGLVFAGVSGTCAMASLLKRMPWNRVAMA
jgi:rhodanese-related sulfurtransferase